MTIIATAVIGRPNLGYNDIDGFTFYVETVNTNPPPILTAPPRSSGDILVALVARNPSDDSQISVREGDTFNSWSNMSGAGVAGFPDSRDTMQMWARKCDNTDSDNVKVFGMTGTYIICAVWRLVGNPYPTTGTGGVIVSPASYREPNDPGAERNDAFSLGNNYLMKLFATLKVTTGAPSLNFTGVDSAVNFLSGSSNLKTATGVGEDFSVGIAYLEQDLDTSNPGPGNFTLSTSLTSDTYVLSMSVKSGDT